MASRWRIAALGTAALLIAAACGSGSPSETVGGVRSSGAASPSSGAAAGAASPTSGVAASVTPSVAWLAARVEQPAEIEAQPTNAPAFCSPCHPIVGTYITALVATPSGFVALGRELPPSRAAAWTASTDATQWTRDTTLPAPDGSGIAAAIGAGDGMLAVGTSGGAAAVWHWAGAGAAWTLTALPAPAAGLTEQLAAVTQAADGYVAAGYTQDSLGSKRATFWRSADGLSWSRAAAAGLGGGATTSRGATASNGVPAPTEVTGLAARGNVLVAVGIAGDERRGTSAVWRSDDAGRSWAAASDPSFGGGRMLAVTATPAGFAAVGENVDQTAAAAWYSTDGSTWTAASGSGLDNCGAQMVMMAVAVKAGGGFVADGWKSDAGNGSAVVWDSSDGRSWIRKPQDPSFSGAGMAAVLAAPRLLAAGTMGWPDTHAAQVWVSAGD